jgi:hypothetical protein
MAFLLLTGSSACASMQASIDIKAPPQNVWALVVDVERYKDWNPFFTEGHGPVADGATLRLTMKPVGQSPKNFSPTVLNVNPGESLVWRGRLLLPGLFDGTHHLIVERISAVETRFTQEETFSGVLVPFVGFDPYLAGWRRMNEALKVRAEALPKWRVSTAWRFAFV